MPSGSKIYFPLLAYGGVCRAEFSMALQHLFLEATRIQGLSFIASGIFFESLISRGRNAAAAAALHYECDHVLFIDADISFSAKDVFKLIDHNEDVVCGLYPKKYYNSRKISALAKDSPQVFETEKWKSLSTDFTTEMTPASMKSLVEGESLVETDYAATGFMLIKTTVFKRLSATFPNIKYTNEIDGYAAFGDNFYDFFPAAVNPLTKKYESEDYGFCRLWRSVGGKIHFDPSINLTHIGTQAYTGSIREQLKHFPWQQ